MNGKSLKIPDLFVKAFMIIIFFLSIIQISSNFSFFAPYILQSLFFGIPVWIITGAISPYLVYPLIIKPMKSLKKNLYILRSRNLLTRYPVYHRVLQSIESSLGPTLLAFGILNLALNYFDFFFELGFIVVCHCSCLLSRFRCPHYFGNFRL